MTPTDNLDDLAELLYSAVVSDICDRRDLREQTARPGLRAMTDPHRPLVGWAHTVRAEAVLDAPQRHYGTEIDFIDGLRRGDVVVAETGLANSAFWGELFSTAAVGRGARGAVVDGYVRDVDKVNRLGFPLYAKGSHPADSLGRLSVVERGGQVACHGVQVRSGDLVVADKDGVVFVPQDAVAQVVVDAVEKAGLENDARGLLLRGGLLAEVWERYRVL